MIWRSPLHRLHGQDRYSIRRAMVRDRILRRQHDAWTTRIKMDVQAVLTRLA